LRLALVLDQSLQPLFQVLPLLLRRLLCRLVPVFPLRFGRLHLSAELPDLASKHLDETALLLQLLSLRCRLFRRVLQRRLDLFERLPNLRVLIESRHWSASGCALLTSKPTERVPLVLQLFPATHRLCLRPDLSFRRFGLVAPVLELVEPRVKALDKRFQGIDAVHVLGEVGWVLLLPLATFRVVNVVRLRTGTVERRSSCGKGWLDSASLTLAFSGDPSPFKRLNAIHQSL
jgi:hypothetical protein